jgi:hypothetical protein
MTFSTKTTQVQIDPTNPRRRHQRERPGEPGQTAPSDSRSAAGHRSARQPASQGRLPLPSGDHARTAADRLLKLTGDTQRCQASRRSGGIPTRADPRARNRAIRLKPTRRRARVRAPASPKGTSRHRICFGYRRGSPRCLQSARGSPRPRPADRCRCRR